MSLISGMLLLLLGMQLDHQRMMVDPIFMIVKNVCSFLMTVTPTALTPSAAILLEFT